MNSTPSNGEIADAQSSSSISVSRGGAQSEVIEIHGHYNVECIGADGQVKWVDTIENLVVTVGKNDLLDKYFAGTAYTAAWYMGLVDGGTAPSYAATDTLAVHAGWTENAAYSGTNRITVGWGAAAAGSKASTATSFAITGTATLAGALLCVTQLRATTTGVLYSAGSFTGGNRAVINGDTLNVTYTATI
jgi:hypothetical protein